MMNRIDIEAARGLLDFGSRLDSEPRAEEQLQGSVALHNLLEEHRCAYVADEVGMGKTYVALGAMALMQHFQPKLRVLIITPRENIQNKWMKELGNLVRHNIRFPDLRVKALDHRPAMPLVKCDRLLDLVHQVNLRPQGCFFMRMSSFSLGMADMSGSGDSPGRRSAVGLRDELRKHLPWLGKKALDLRVRDRQTFKDSFARALCCALPEFDLVIVDEAHNFKHGFTANVAARNRVVALAMGHPQGEAPKSIYPGYGRRAKRVLFLSATPIEESYTQLWNQLDVFGFGESFSELKDKELQDEDKKSVARRFLIRRVTSMKVGYDELTKNLYRREWRRGGVHQHDEPIRVTDVKQRLVLALVQKKVAESIGHERFGTSFQTGMLASFESFQQTASHTARPDEEARGNFDDSDQTEDAVEREGVDVRNVNYLAKSYRNKFQTELPHPKMDALVASLATVWQTGTKALVFVRRIASVTDLKRKLDEKYDEWIFCRLRSELPQTVSPKLEQMIKLYLDERMQSRNEQALESAPLENAATHDAEDKGGKDTFFAWFFRGFGPTDVLSGATLLKRFSSKGSVYATFFEDNHVSALLRCEASQTLAELGRIFSIEDGPLRGILCERARRRLTTKAKKLTRADMFEALQTAAIAWLSEKPGPWQEEARIILHERFNALPDRKDSNALQIPLANADILNLPTFFTELRSIRYVELRAVLWPSSTATNLRDQFREEALRAELLGSAARLGHGLIDLYVLAIQQTNSMASGARDDDGDDSQHGDLSRITRYLDRLECQRMSPPSKRGWSAFDELAEIAANFELILDVNLPDARTTELSEVRKEFGNKLLGNQQPVGGMWGSVNGRLIKQFRMPGYPLVMITTDLVQEGEDLHTFCSSIHHYGISWTPSSMEQRTGRIDRVRSLTERRLLAMGSAPNEEKLQVYFPHLEDTVEVLQVRRLLERMNRFLKLMHEGLQVKESEERTLNVAKEILRHHDPVPVLTGRLKTAFPVSEEDLHGDQTELARTRDQADSLVARFTALRKMGRDDRLKFETPESGDAESGRIYGTILLKSRKQPFGLYLHSFDKYPLIRCISPVGRVADEHELNEALQLHSLSTMRIGALEHGEENQSYDLTAEDDVLLSNPDHDATRVLQLILRVTAQADELERSLLGTDEPLTTFREDLQRE
jgi:hypothetical protein